MVYFLFFLFSYSLCCTKFVGQLIVASLFSRNIKARLILRDPEKATSLFGKQDDDKLQVWCRIGVCGYEIIFVLFIFAFGK